MSKRSRYSWETSVDDNKTDEKVSIRVPSSENKPPKKKTRLLGSRSEFASSNAFSKSSLSQDGKKCLLGVSLKDENCQKNVKKENNNNNNDNNSENNKNGMNGMNEDCECTVCYEDFKSNDKIFQCFEGHLLCSKCYPKFDQCPTCNCNLLKDGIRNRFLENVLSSNRNNNSNNNTNNKNIKSKKVENTVFCDCYFFNEKFKNETCLWKCNIRNIKDLRNHVNICLYRRIKCSFVDCKWIDHFKNFETHLENSHFTLSSPIKHKHGKKYEFSHAIKFPSPIVQHAINGKGGKHGKHSKDGKHEKDGKRKNMVEQNHELIWPKIQQFDDKQKFFVLTRYADEAITIFIRDFRLPSLKNQQLSQIEKTIFEKYNIDCSNNKGEMQCISKMRQLNVDSSNDKLFSNNDESPLGEYFIELKGNSNKKGKSKEKEKEKGKANAKGNGKENENGNGNSNANENGNSKCDENDCEATPLRWPQQLYSICLPFDFEYQTKCILSIPQSIFQRYWKIQAMSQSAVLRFRFQVQMN